MCPKIVGGIAPSVRRSCFAMLRAAVVRRARDFKVRASAADHGRLIAVPAISRSLHGEVTYLSLPKRSICLSVQNGQFVHRPF